MELRPRGRPRLPIGVLLKPHVPALAVGLVAVVGEGVANLLEPWPLKVVLDSVLQTRPGNGWLDALVRAAAGDDRLAILTVACVAVLAIAALDAVCS